MIPCKPYFQLLGGLFSVLCILIFSAAITSCRSTVPVIVPEYHQEVVHRVDTVHQTDSFISTSTTTIREVDSATVAALGYQINGLKSAYLIEVNNMQRQINQLLRTHGDTVHVTDTIPKIVEVPAKVSKWQQLKMDFGELLILAFLLTIALFFIKRTKKSG